MLKDPARKRRVGLISLGCPKNRVDSEILLARLEDAGYELSDDLGAVDTVIVNTCGFIEEAKQESIDTILEVAACKERDRGKQLLVAGCMVNRYGSDLAREIPEIDGFIGLDELRQAGDLVELGGGPPPASSRSREIFDHTDRRRLTTPGYAYLKVAEGCNNPCTFCAIPLWRGRFRSRSIASLVAEAQQMEASGAQELCLVAQDTTRYGEDLGLGRHGLLRLIEELLAGTEVPWIRFLYAYPTTLDPELLRLMGSERRFCSYLDIPLQHSHADILRRMRRAGDGDRYLKLIEAAREAVPDLWIRSTFIVGFPGETESHFRHLEDFVQAAGLDHLGAFVFSPEKGTAAADASNRPARGVARERHRRLLERQRPISLRRREALVGERIEVLVEGVCEESEHLLEGRHAGMAPGIDGRLLLADGFAPPGSLAVAEVVEAYADDLVGHLVEAGRLARAASRSQGSACR